MPNLDDAYDAHVLLYSAKVRWIGVSFPKQCGQTCGSYDSGQGLGRVLERRVLTAYFAASYSTFLPGFRFSRMPRMKSVPREVWFWTLWCSAHCSHLVDTFRGRGFMSVSLAGIAKHESPQTVFFQVRRFHSSPPDPVCALHRARVSCVWWLNPLRIALRREAARRQGDGSAIWGRERSVKGEPAQKGLRHKATSSKSLGPLFGPGTKKRRVERTWRQGSAKEVKTNRRRCDSFLSHQPR